MERNSDIFIDIQGRVANIGATHCANSKFRCKYHFSLQSLNYCQSKVFSVMLHSGKDSLRGAECGTVLVLHCHKVLSVGLSSCLEAISFWKKLLSKHIKVGVWLWTFSSCTSQSVLTFSPSLPVLSYQSGNTAALLSGSANESSRMEVTPTYCKLILSKALTELLASPNEIWSGWYCSQKMLMFFSKWQMELDIVYIRSKLFTSAFTFLLQRTYKHLFSFCFL